MTEWKEVIGSQEKKPLELDTTSSPLVVYERRNIISDVIEQRQGEEVNLISCWRYEEREWQVDEFARAQAELETPGMQLLMQAISEIELKIEMLGV